ncbi:hypothetical protein [Dyadobacter luticola]|uniref:Uncharacterized protein n=1 Tax=Dyadobacter luticola TaxID=1979387 RepID=A0A5R9KW11_9BACT|nr:hypothetical protein [Dyadobacter luticola]TLV00279.1 hypothetical protein FEN17_12305 [Dyadobacter luticola]
MKTVKTLSAGLGLACMMMLSSCSKDDVQTPQPLAGTDNRHSSLKTDGEVTLAPYFAPVEGPTTGIFQYPANWAQSLNAIPDGYNGPLSGLSSFYSVWGETGFPWGPWLKPMAYIPGYLNAYKMLTLRAKHHYDSKPFWAPGVTTTIKNLVPGKTYSITLYLATTIRNEPFNADGTCKYAKAAKIKMYPYTNDMPLTVNVDLTGNEAKWVKKTITFTPTKDNAPFYFQATEPDKDTYTFTNLFVPSNGIYELKNVAPVKL